MEQRIFTGHFQSAAVRTLDFARQFILEDLSDKLIFRVRLNQSYDANLRPDQKVYPEDSSSLKAHELRRCAESEVVQTLWRDSAVPEWVDIAVAGQTPTETIVELRCCGRFTSDDSRLYYRWTDIAPFSVHGPSLPAGHKQGDRFSIWHRLAAWDRDEIEMARPHIHKVWALTLFGSQFDDTWFTGLSTFRDLEALELNESPVRGNGVRSLNRHPKLRVLRIHISNPELFDLKDATLLPNLKTLDIKNLPARPCGLERLLEQVPNLNSLTLTSRGELSLNASFSKALDYLTIAAENVRGEVTLPYNVGLFSLHLSKASGTDVLRLLQGVHKARSLFLIRTPVDDAIAMEIIGRLKPEFVNLAYTNVSADGLRHLIDTYPGIRIHANPDSPDPQAVSS